VLGPVRAGALFSLVDHAAANRDDSDRQSSRYE